VEQERRKLEADSPVWQAISGYKLLSDDIGSGLQKLIVQTLARCGCRAGVFVLLREPLPEMRVAVGHEQTVLTPQSLFVRAATTEGLLMLEDAAQDPQFKDCPELQLGKIGLFASIAVRAPNGIIVGVLSVFDGQVRAELPNAKPEILNSFVQVFDQFLQRRALQELETDTGLLGRTFFERTFIDEWKVAQSTKNKVTWLIFSLPTLGRINKQFGAAKADHIVALLAQLIRQKLMINRQIVGRVSGSSVGVFLPEHLSIDFLETAVSAVRGELVSTSAVMLESAAAIFHLSPAEFPDADPAAVLRALERIVAGRKICRHERVIEFFDKDIRELAGGDVPEPEDQAAVPSVENVEKDAGSE
jgi:GGDEF domain-containing protein